MCGSAIACLSVRSIPPKYHRVDNMIVYKDLISGDEMMTDAFPQNPVVCDGETIEGMFEVGRVLTAVSPIVQWYKNSSKSCVN